MCMYIIVFELFMYNIFPLCRLLRILLTLVTKNITASHLHVKYNANY